jgi:hypothetical protein
MLSVIYAECHKLAIMLSVIMLNAIMLSVVAPFSGVNIVAYWANW